MHWESLAVERLKGVAMIRINRPETMNALETSVKKDLIDCFQSFYEDNDVRVIVLTGTGKAFCAGGNLRELEEKGSIDHVRKQVLLSRQMILTIQALQKPIIAAVNGTAAGSGVSIALACDLIIASDKARFSLGFVRVGLVPDSGASYFLPRLVGLNKAKELALTGRMVSALEMADLGLVNQVVSHEEIEEKALRLAGEIAEHPPLAIAFTKKVLNQGYNLNLLDALEAEAQYLTVCRQTKDHVEGVKAFREKRKPVFSGQ